MSRRDTIIIAVLINTGMLAILFMMAIHTEDDFLIESFETSGHQLVEKTQEIHEIKEIQQPIALAQTAAKDELDHILKDYAAPAPAPVMKSQPATPVVQTAPREEKRYVEVTVKRGDCLGKIALANNTSVREIKQANGLSTERIDIGQVLQVPVNTKNKVKKEPIRQDTLVVDGAEFYTLKKGDNPWKIARQFHVEFDDLLKLNNLNEERARNLKVGDRIRVQ